jgi:peptidoglycan/LPS O-acetylase OafA/YrhL
MLSGVIVAGYAAAGLFFLRFWRDTHDRLFAIFATAFWLLCLQRFLLVMQPPGVSGENVAYLYLVRLLAFVLILVGILDKNRGGTAKS